jgi:CRP-like cAMP-binding protein
VKSTGGTYPYDLCPVPEDLERRIAALARTSIFADLDERSRRRIAQAMGEASFRAGHVLIEPRTTGAGLFVLEEGTVVVEPRNSEPRELGAGEVVGELALLMREGVRTARVQAKTDVRCLTLDRRSLHEALEDEPQLAIALLETAAERLSRDLSG